MYAIYVQYTILYNIFKCPKFPSREHIYCVVMHNTDLIICKRANFVHFIAYQF
jgi:hypothetical protein